MVKQSIFKADFPAKKIPLFFKIKISACECSDDGSRDISCDDDTGKCPCRNNVIGDKCTFCSPGFTGFPNCEGM